MSKGLIAVVVILLIFGFVGCGKYNGLVGKDEVVKESWAKVESQYQRRADLIPNLVNTVKGAADFEKSTLTAVIEARAKATSTTINADQLTPENIKNFQGAQDQLSGALSRLLVSVEKYPDLKANQNFLELQAQLEGTENRIAVARNDFNAVVKDYNQEVRTFPTNIFAGVFGFAQKGYFTAAAGSENAPTVKF
ncbi:LemA family protein [Dyadobacter subterraneus]|uniref:LemA family protein n=1 Tax=Dyadobacter subterraneus TaxID=2773304 RepID=A0ABR9WIM6_9BACT|nr:LemA family protein [Dyadobacter subterraneus]MBE9465372.1 LemA family protein [Dyadobacter subterraneus]